MSMFAMITIEKWTALRVVLSRFGVQCPILKLEGLANLSVAILDSLVLLDSDIDGIICFCVNSVGPKIGL